MKTLLKGLKGFLALIIVVCLSPTPAVADDVADQKAESVNLREKANNIGLEMQVDLAASVVQSDAASGDFTYSEHHRLSAQPDAV